MDDSTENTPSPNLVPKRSRSKLRFLSPLKRHWKLLVEAMVSGALLVGIVTVAVWGYEYLYNNGNVSGTPYTVWSIGVIVIAAAAGLIVSIGLPVLWGKSGGFKRVLGIITTEVILLAIAAVITGFVLNHQNPPINGAPYPTGPGCYTNANCAFPE